MLNCRACLWRCVDALDVPAANAHRLQQTVNRHAKPTTQRRAQSTQNARPTTERPRYNSSELSNLTRNGKEPWKNSAVRANQKTRERVAMRREPPNLEQVWKRDPSISQTDWSNRKRELRYLQDPLELAVFVRQQLKKGKIVEMKQLVVMASQSMDCIVSWNHIVDYLLANGKINEALNVYNDMKKRAQFPDSYTYTIILRGLAMNAHTSGVLSKALSVYHSLYAPNSRVEPSIIHTNAALSVCARALDMDALWGIAGQIPEKGPAQANSITYVTILNAIRQSILINAPKGESEENAAARKERGVMEGRRMWEEIITRWRNSDLTLDEELVCAMGRLLLVGARPRDWDDVLSLIEQTMDIPRMVPRIGTIERELAGAPRLREPTVHENYRFDDDHLAPTQPPMRGSEFLALVPNKDGRGSLRSTQFVKPGSNTLSLVQEACQRVVAQKAAQEYWDLLTDPNVYNVKPDFENLKARLRILRQTRSSSAALQLLQDEIVGKGLKPGRGIFRIVMSTCVRDKNNHNSLRTGGKVLEIMLRTLEDADAKSTAMYAELATAFPLAKGQDLVDALTILHPIVRNLRVQIGVGGKSLAYLTGEERQDAILTLRKVYGLYDRLLFSNLIEERHKAPLKVERAKLAAYIARVTYKDSQRGSDKKDEQAEDGVEEVEEVEEKSQDIEGKGREGRENIRGRGERR